MCNLYSITTNQAAIATLFRVLNRYVGNLPPMPGVFPDYPAPVTAGCDARREAVDHSVFESKRQETCALMAEKVEVCGTDCCNSATPARNDLAVPRFAHDSHCQCGQGGILLLRRHVIWGMSVKTAF
jgi:hypothetical protein